MSLGPDNQICKDEFIEAMRQRLMADDPAMAGNVDQEDVQKNLGALGLAVYRIATVHADVRADAAADPDFWDWVADVDAWMQAMATWQSGVRAAVQAWSPTQPAEQDLRDALLALADPGAPPPAPSELRGKIE
jgi:hypothetical protein